MRDLRALAYQRLPVSTALKQGALGLAVLALAACEGSVGFSGLQAEWERTRSGPYYVVSVAEDRAVVSAKGRQVAIEPAEGFCLAEESIETSGRSAFALIGDCALDTPVEDAERGDRGELHLPRGVPGIITVSISGQAGIADRAGLEGLASFLQTPDGRQMLGRGSDSSKVKVVEARRIGAGVFVLVDDPGQDVVPILDPRFWRGFIEVNDRLAVVTVSGFRANPLGSDRMLKYLVNQMQTLAVANNEPINEPQQVMIARADGAGGDASDGVPLSEVRREAFEVTVVGTDGALLWPVPTPRPVRPSRVVDAGSGDETFAATPPPRGRPGSSAAAGGPDASNPDQAATRFAPERAPSAPRRPGNA